MPTDTHEHDWLPRQQGDARYCPGCGVTEYLPTDTRPDPLREAIEAGFNLRMLLTNGNAERALSETLDEVLPLAASGAVTEGLQLHGHGGVADRIRQRLAGAGADLYTLRLLTGIVPNDQTAAVARLQGHLDGIEEVVRDIEYARLSGATDRPEPET